MPRELFLFRLTSKRQTVDSLGRTIRRTVHQVPNLDGHFAIGQYHAAMRHSNIANIDGDLFVDVCEAESQKHYNVPDPVMASSTCSIRGRPPPASLRVTRRPAEFTLGITRPLRVLALQAARFYRQLRRRHGSCVTTMTEPSSTRLEDVHGKPLVSDGLWTFDAGGGSIPAPIRCTFFSARGLTVRQRMFGTITPVLPTLTPATAQWGPPEAWALGFWAKTGRIITATARNVNGLRALGFIGNSPLLQRIRQVSSLCACFHVNCSQMVPRTNRIGISPSHFNAPSAIP